MKKTKTNSYHYFISTAGKTFIVVPGIRKLILSGSKPLHYSYKYNFNPNSLCFFERELHYSRKISDLFGKSKLKTCNVQKLMENFSIENLRKTPRGMQLNS